MVKDAKSDNTQSEEHPKSDTEKIEVEKIEACVCDLTQNPRKQKNKTKNRISIFELRSLKF